MESPRDMLTASEGTSLTYIWFVHFHKKVPHGGEGHALIAVLRYKLLNIRDRLLYKLN